jgi:hypothetical protein
MQFTTKLPFIWQPPRFALANQKQIAARQTFSKSFALVTATAWVAAGFIIYQLVWASLNWVDVVSYKYF